MRISFGKSLYEAGTFWASGSTALCTEHPESKMSHLCLLNPTTFGFKGLSEISAA